MAVKLTSVKCPECKAILSIEENREKVFCSYCGTPIIITNENEYIYRHIDEAEITQAETERMIRLKELELRENQMQQKNQLRKILTYIWIASIIVVSIICLIAWGKEDEWAAFFCLFYVGIPIAGGGAYLLFKVLPEKDMERELYRNGGIRFPKSLEPFTEQTVQTVENTLRDAGFTNISTINMHDVVVGLLQKPNIVESISVNGEKIVSAGKVYLPNTPIAITYHGK